MYYGENVLFFEIEISYGMDVFFITDFFLQKLATYTMGKHTFFGILLTMVQEILYFEHEIT